MQRQSPFSTQSQTPSYCNVITTSAKICSIFKVVRTPVSRYRIGRIVPTYKFYEVYKIPTLILARRHCQQTRLLSANSFRYLWYYLSVIMTMSSGFLWTLVELITFCRPLFVAAFYLPLLQGWLVIGHLSQWISTIRQGTHKICSAKWEGNVWL